ncbi:hypothetical protein I8752_03575 [Nostocaceae cyanobacterium CENA369]|uniref:Uncharacterized protein n=1 Tax=Dendronalium phyllosphericum CENA369 TaxID=1725256 RepID=A0A8J7I452_9NOST|nr:hypothetical protein [Dendronalium phyllosphericum CENA369]
MVENKFYLPQRRGQPDIKFPNLLPTLREGVPPTTESLPKWNTCRGVP